MAKMNMTSLDVLTDEVFGEVGTPKRDAMEKQLQEEVNAYLVGETIRKMRQAQNLTQEEKAELVDNDSDVSFNLIDKYGERF